MLVVAFGLVALLQVGIDRERGVYAEIEEALYIKNGDTLGKLALGNEGLLASVYWTRVVQYFGRNQIEHTGMYKFKLLAPLLQITTDLDPHLLIAYRFGAIFLMGRPPEGAGEPQAALQFLRRGIVANPDYWRLWQDLGFVYYWQFKDYKTASKIFAIGGRMPGAQYWMKALAGTLAAKAGDIKTSEFLWSEIYRQAETDATRRTAEEHLAALRAEDDMQKLNQLLANYRYESGREPQSLFDLCTGGLLRCITNNPSGVPDDPSGVPYGIGPDGHVALGPGSKINLHLLQ